MTTLFIESGADATYGFDFYPTTVGSPTISTTSPNTGPRCLACPGGGENYIVTGDLLAAAGRRLSQYYRFTAAPGGADRYFCGAYDTGYTPIFLLSLDANRRISLWANDVAKTGTVQLTAGAWTRISVAYVLTSTSSFTIKVFVNGVEDISATGADGSLVSTAALRWIFGYIVNLDTSALIFSYDDLYIDNSTALTDPGDIHVTAKLPVAENTNNFDTAITAEADRWLNVNDRAIDTAKGWQHAAATDVQENYTLEAAAVGDVDISAMTLVARTAWVHGNQGAYDGWSLDTTKYITGNAAPLETTYTCAAAAKVLVVGIITLGATIRAGTAPTYNTVAMTQADTNRSATETCCQLYYLINPGTGSAYTLSIPNTGTAKTLYVFLHSFIPPGGAAASYDTSLGAVGSAAIATSGNMTLSAVNNLVVSCAGTGYRDAPSGNGDAGTYTDLGAYAASQQYKLTAGATTYAATFTQGGSDDSCVCAVAIKAPETAAPDLMDNGTESAITLTTSAALFTKITDSATYPSNAAGIGMRSTVTTADTFLYECGTLIAYLSGATALSISVSECIDSIVVF